MNKLITIGRQFGSGGAEVATKLAEKLGIKCYDKEILLEAAKKNGIFEGVAEQYDVDGHQSFFRHHLRTESFRTESRGTCSW